MRLLFFTDTHIRGTNPSGRKDNFYEALKAKFNEIRNISDSMNIDFILNGGDWFDRPDISPSVVKDFAVLIKSFNKPVYSVAGNHDIFGQNPETLGRTMLGLLEGIGIIKLLSPADEVILNDGKVRLQLTGSPYSHDIDTESFPKYYVVKKKKNVDYLINIVHGMLLDKPFFEGIHFTLIKDIINTQADITFAGHYHSGFGIKKIEEKYIINPGSLARTSNTRSEMVRTPKVVLVDLGREINVKEIELKSALAGRKVLYGERSDNMMYREILLDRFYTGLGDTGSFSYNKLENLISEIASSERVAEKVKLEALKRISDARQGTGAGDENL